MHLPSKHNLSSYNSRLKQNREMVGKLWERPPAIGNIHPAALHCFVHFGGTCLQGKKRRRKEGEDTNKLINPSMYVLKLHKYICICTLYIYILNDFVQDNSSPFLCCALHQAGWGVTRAWFYDEFQCSSPPCSALPHHCIEYICACVCKERNGYIQSYTYIYGQQVGQKQCKFSKDGESRLRKYVKRNK